MRYLVTFRPETAMRPERVEADGLRILDREGVALFEPTSVAGMYHPTVTWPLRFIERIELEAPEPSTGSTTSRWPERA